MKGSAAFAVQLSASNPGALRVVMEALETFAANEVGENEACLYFLLLSTRGYVGPKLWELYRDRGGMSAARAINLVVEEAKLELVAGSARDQG